MRGRASDGSVGLSIAHVLHEPRVERCHTLFNMRTLTVRLPEPLAASIESESRARDLSKSDVVRERLQRGTPGERRSGTLDVIADLVGSAEGLPVDLSARKKAYLKSTGYGRKRSR